MRESGVWRCVREEGSDEKCVRQAGSYIVRCNILQCMRGIFYNVLLEEIVGANLFEV